jgi:hypothetical protein
MGLLLNLFRNARPIVLRRRFSGYIDGVSKQLHVAHMKQSNFEKPDGKGFGHMGRPYPMGCANGSCENNCKSTIRQSRRSN